MNKSNLIKAVAKAQGFTLKKAEAVVGTVFDTIAQALAQGDRVELRGFGCFQTKRYEGYHGRNPKTGEVIDVGPKVAPVFKTSGKLRAKVDR